MLPSLANISIMKIMDIQDLLARIEKTIHTPQEREYFLIHIARYAYILKRIENLFKNKKIRILDVGCFPYHMGSALEIMGHEVWGISSAHEPIQSAKVKVCNIETDKFPFKADFFDITLCSEVLEHLPQAPAQALREMYRVTKPGGVLILTTPNISRSINRAKLTLGKSIAYPLAQVLENHGKGSVLYHRHNREYTLQELDALIKFSGWQVLEASYFVSYTPMRRRVRPDTLVYKLGKWMNYHLMTIAPPLRDTLFLLAQK